MSKKVEKILSLYDDLSEDEKIRLFLSLSQKDMREHYDPSYRRYRIKAVNFYGKLLVDTVLSKGLGGGGFYNLREARAVGLGLLNYQWNRYKYEPTQESYMNEKEIIKYRNDSYVELDIFEEK